MIDTKRRARYALDALKAHAERDLEDWQDKRERLIDVLTDLRHWADREGIDYTDADRMAERHHYEEANQ